MKSSPAIIIPAVFLIAFFMSPVNPAAETVRPVKDDVGFCWNQASMKILIDYLEANEKERFETEGLAAAISPHDDYLYAGRIYYPLFRTLRTREVVIFGVTHGTVRKEIGDPHGIVILDEYPAWSGLTGPVTVSPLREAVKAGLKKKDFIVSNRAHELEHSIEALLPFLQYFNPEIKITPIMVTPMPLTRMEELSAGLSDIIAAYIKAKGLKLGRDIVLLISSDGNHYGRDFDNTPWGEGEKAWRTGLEYDRRLINSYLTGVIESQKIHGLTGELWGATYADYGTSYWCGKYSIPFGLLTALKVVDEVGGQDLTGRLFRYSDTYSEGVLPLKKTGMGTTAPFSLRHWVSFCSIGYYAKEVSDRTAEGKK